MTLSGDESGRLQAPAVEPVQYNKRLVPGSCVLETLALTTDAHLRFVFVDDFDQALTYGQRRLFADLVSPEDRGGDDEQREPLERWRRMRVVFAPGDLARSWVAASRALAALRAAFSEQGYSTALADQLREVVNTYSLDLELGDIYSLPQDIEALLARIGNPFVWWDDALENAEQERQAFDFANAEHRALLARRLREQNDEVTDQDEESP